jgi:hypothetical protein
VWLPRLKPKSRLLLRRSPHLPLRLPRQRNLRLAEAARDRQARLVPAARLDTLVPRLAGQLQATLLARPPGTLVGERRLEGPRPQVAERRLGAPQPGGVERQLAVEPRAQAVRELRAVQDQVVLMVAEAVPPWVDAWAAVRRRAA